MIRCWKYSAWSIAIAGLILTVFSAPCMAQSKSFENQSSLPPSGGDRQDQVPEVLRVWIPWALWDDQSKKSPSTYRDPAERIHFWPALVDVHADDRSGRWKLPVQVFRESWVPLPGGKDHWPIAVTDGAKEMIVVEHDGVPSVRLKPGAYTLEGRWEWNSLPQKLEIPRSYGWIRLQVRNEVIATPNWDASGQLWLSRVTMGEVEKDNHSFQIYRLIQDGSPIWLRTEIDLTATGKSREEDLGFVLPEGWQLSYVMSALPVAIDDTGKLKAQIRAGNWKIVLDAFRNEDFKELKYAVSTPPAQPVELLAWQSAPQLRTVEMQGVMPIDAQTTRFPERWRNLTVYQWKTDMSITFIEKTRGMGVEKPNALNIQRVLWLDDDGSGITYQDWLKGEQKQIDRLDVASNHQLGVVRVRGERQLITENPSNGSQGFELRSRNPEIEAVGRASVVGAIPATGWQTPADQLEVELYLPPGWRMLALFGADRIEGDWLTAWTLLDLFLLLVFSLAVLRLYGILPGLVAFLAFALTYHEPGSPRWTWFFLLIPLALLRVVGAGKQSLGLQWWRNIALLVLLFNLIPFAAAQIQNAIYPQLEPSSVAFQNRTLFEWMQQTSNTRSDSLAMSTDSLNDFSGSGMHPSDVAKDYRQSQIPMSRGMENAQIAQNSQTQSAQVSNLQYDPKTSIQTGVAKPQWVGNVVRCRWEGPVAAEETIRPVLLSCNAHRLLTVVRLLLLGLLLGILLEGLRDHWKRRLLVAAKVPKVSSIGVFLAIVFSIGGDAPRSLWAQIPDIETLNVLKERFERASDAFPNAADIPEMTLKLEQNQLALEATIHAASAVAVPLPGKAPSWFPRQVQLDGQDATVTRRADGHLWMLIPEGIHRVRAEGRIVESTEWSWAFVLPPRHLRIDAPEWTWTGLSSEGKPDNQVIFVRKEQVVEGVASYDQRNFRSAFLVERRLEIGLVWKSYTTVKRLSQTGKAVSVSVPLLTGEQIVTPGVNDANGSVEMNFGSDDKSFEWQSELPVSEQITLIAKPISNISEKWSVETSPVWSMQSEGEKPIFGMQKENLIPEWYPWPGDSVLLKFRRPAAVAGKLLTIQSLVHRLEIGNRQRKSSLWFEVESSLGGEYSIPLPPNSTVTNISISGRTVPIRRQEDQCLILVQPGSQTVKMDWNTEEPIRHVVSFPSLQMPDEVANIRSTMEIPSSQWVLWAQGPMRGPAVRFWVILAVSICAAWILGSRFDSPLKTWEWILLAIGLTQVSVFASLLIIGWLFSISFRRRLEPMSLKRWQFNTLQVFHVLLTIVALVALISVVTVGLLGSPRMFIVGNESFEGYLQWFTPRSNEQLPQPWVFTVSIWYYRLMMLVWALWLANSLLSWLKEWWRSLTQGVGWRTKPPKSSVSGIGHLPSDP